MSPRGNKTTTPPTEDAATTTTENSTTTTTTTAKPKKAPKVALEAKLTLFKDKLADLLHPAFGSIAEGEFGKAVESMKTPLETAILLVRGLADDWKPVFKRTAKKGLAQGDVAKTKVKFLELFKEKGLGAGPFKVLGVFSSDKSVKLQTMEGVVVYLPQNQVEKVTTAAPTEQSSG